MGKKVLLSIDKTEVYEENQKLTLRLETDPWTAVYRRFEVEEIRKLAEAFNYWLLKIDQIEKELPNPNGRTADYNKRGD